MTIPKIGAHLSLGQDPGRIMRSAAQDGFGCMQIFASSPGAWKPPILESARARALVEAHAAHGLSPLVIHAIYLINLASADPELVRRSRESLIATLHAADVLGASTVVTHIGSHGGRGFESVAAYIAAGLVEVLERAPGSATLALENSAGSGGIVGSKLEEIGELIKYAGHHPRLRVALDTAHFCGSGWDFAVESTAERLVQTLEGVVGLDRLALVHANDSLVPCGSRRDRHANIGDGYIGPAGFRNLLRRPELTSVPWIVETPNLERRAQDLKNLQRLAESPLEVAHGP